MRDFRQPFQPKKDRPTNVDSRKNAITFERQRRAEDVAT